MNRKSTNSRIRASHDNNVPAGRKTAVAAPSVRRAKKVKRKVKRGSAVSGAENRLKKFRQASILTVAITGFMLIIFSPGEAGLNDNSMPQDTVFSEGIPDSVAIIRQFAVQDLVDSAMQESGQDEGLLSDDVGSATKKEALGALEKLWNSFIVNLPKMLVAIGALFFAWLLAKLVRLILRKTLRRWRSRAAITTLVVIVVWLFAIGIAFSIVTGDIRALVGSFGLIGLALSWSLQTPIESFTGWLLNSFQGYYQVGDRIKVGEVFGDVYSIDYLTTTVWEIGSPQLGGFVNAEQPTGKMVTFPNNEILTGTVVNLTADFPFVWDELSTGVANESDIRLTIRVIEQVSVQFLGDYMKVPTRQYAAILQKAGLTNEVAEQPQVFLAVNDSYTEIIVRYLVGARERRRWKSNLILEINRELGKEEYKGKIVAVYPRQQIQFIDTSGKPVEVTDFQNKKGPA